MPLNGKVDLELEQRSDGTNRTPPSPSWPAPRTASSPKMCRVDGKRPSGTLCELLRPIGSSGSFSDWRWWKS